MNITPKTTGNVHEPPSRHTENFWNHPQVGKRLQPGVRFPPDGRFWGGLSSCLSGIHLHTTLPTCFPIGQACSMCVLTSKLPQSSKKLSSGEEDDEVRGEMVGAAVGVSNASGDHNRHDDLLLE